MSTTKKNYDFIVIGGGVLGTFHAYRALQHGLKVALFEKNNTPQGATVRNFGLVIPSGLAAEWQRLGRRSLDIYRDLQASFDITIRRQGSVYLASDSEEKTLLEELHTINAANGYPSRLLTQGACLQRYPGLRADYCRAGLFFPEEMSMEPRSAIGRILRFLVERFALDYYPGRPLVAVDRSGSRCLAVDAAGRHYGAGQVIICTGTDFELLFPALYASGDLEVSKLQMMQTEPQPSLRIPGNVLTGLSIRRYESFRECPSYAAVKAREDKDSPAARMGVHILFKQAADGSVIIGDSHAYAAAMDKDKLGFDIDRSISSFLEEEARRIMQLEDWTIRKEWYGMYVQSKTGDVFRHTLEDSIHIITGIGGKGMTAGPAYAQENMDSLIGKI